MVTSCGVAARALNSLAMAGIEVLLITTSDLDISLLVHAENEGCSLRSIEEGLRAVNSASKRAILHQVKKMPVHSKTEYTGHFHVQYFYRVTLW